jgi:hypothetical protein
MSSSLHPAEAEADAGEKRDFDRFGEHQLDLSNVRKFSDGIGHITRDEHDRNRDVLVAERAKKIQTIVVGRREVDDQAAIGVLFQARDGRSEIADDVDARAALVDRFLKRIADVVFIVKEESCFHGSRGRTTRAGGSFPANDSLSFGLL